MKRILFYFTMLFAAFAINSCNGSSEQPVINPDDEKQNVSRQLEDGETASAPTSLRIHIDNSGSMRGYTEWQQTNFVTAISDIASLEGASVRMWGNDKIIVGNMATALEKNNFSGADTPFPTIFKTMVGNIDTTDCLEVIVTDGIISLKREDQKNIEASLGQIKNEIRDALKSVPGMAVCVWRLTSGYSNNKGGRDLYFTKQPGRSVKLKEVQRPFFVIAVGKRANIQWLIDEISSKKETMTAMSGAEYLAFGIHDHTTSLKLSSSKYFKNNKLTAMSGSFKVSPDLPECLFDNMTAEEIQQGLELLVNGEKDDNFSATVKGHRLEFKCKSIGKIKKPKNTVTIQLKNTLPDKWLRDYNSDDDTSIKEDIEQQSRTYALATLLRGIYEATDAGKMLIDAKLTFSK